MHPDQYLTFRLALPFTWWLLWLSSVLYIVGWSIYVLFGPRFIRRYSHYGAYQAWQHSERWIIWEWYEFLRRSGRPTDVDILIQKELPTPHTKELPTHCDPSFNLSDHPAGGRLGSEFQISKPSKGKDETWFVLQRKNAVYRLELGPGTANKDTKHAELFWELYGAQASSRPCIRMTIWTMLYISALLFIFNVGQNIWVVFRSIAMQWL